MDPSPLTASALAAIRAWFRSEARPYPWTLTEDPYAIWISEVMLQQTVVSAAVGPFTAWMTRWPDLGTLAAASEQEVLRAWEGLGYATRARNLHRTAGLLVRQGRTTLPNTAQELRSLPGIGEYTASAILSFAFHQPALTLDANLKRVFQRLDAAPEWTSSVELRWRTLWAELVDGSSSREANQAVMQLGQRVCRAKSPSCAVCPVTSSCEARRRRLTDQIPAPSVRQLIEKSTTVVFWHRFNGSQWFLARPLRGRFSHLWMAPPAPTDFLPSRALALPGRVHTYTKYRDRLTPYAAGWAEPGDPVLPEGWVGRWVSVAQAQDLGMVSAYRKIWDEALSPNLHFPS